MSTPQIPGAGYNMPTPNKGRKGRKLKLVQPFFAGMPMAPKAGDAPNNEIPSMQTVFAQVKKMMGDQAAPLYAGDPNANVVEEKEDEEEEE